MSVNFTLPASPKNGETNRPDLFAAALFFMLAAVGKLLAADISAALEQLLGISRPQHAKALYALIYYIGFLLTPILLYMKKNPSAADHMRIKRISARSALLCAAAAVPAAFCMSGITSLWAVLIESMGGTLPDVGLSHNGALLPNLLFAAVLPALCEELLFRGALLNAWEERGSRSAVVITGVWFMLLHTSIIGMPNQLLCGIVLAVVVVSVNSLFAGIIFHIVYNSINLLSAVRESAQSGAAYSALQSAGGANELMFCVLKAAFAGILLILILTEIDRERRRNGRLDFGYPPSYGRDPSLAEYVVLCSGFSVCLILYARDFLILAGWL